MSEEIKKFIDKIPAEMQKELLEELKNRHEKKPETQKVSDEELDMIIGRIRK